MCIRDSKESAYWSMWVEGFTDLIDTYHFSHYLQSSILLINIHLELIHVFYFRFYIGDYVQNEFCPAGQTTCKPCRERIPSCNGLPNGNNTYPGQAGGPLYITCYNDRTIFVRTCEQGVFDPNVKACVTSASEINPGIDKINPGIDKINPGVYQINPGVDQINQVLIR